MANTNSPFGFQDSGSLSGVVPNSGLDQGLILNSYGTQIFRGDPIIRATSGYIQQAAAGTTQILGIFMGCEYYSTAAKQPLWSPYWPAGTPSTLNAKAYFISNPNNVFLVQTANSNTTASAATIANVGMTAQFSLGAGGNTSNGISGAYLDLYQAGDTTTQPFKIVALASTYLAPGSPGSDDTTAYNWVYASFNFQVYRSLDGHS